MVVIGRDYKDRPAPPTPSYRRAVTWRARDERFDRGMAEADRRSQAAPVVIPTEGARAKPDRTGPGWEDGQWVGPIGFDHIGVFDPESREIVFPDAPPVLDDWRLGGCRIREFESGAVVITGTRGFLRAFNTRSEALGWAAEACEPTLRWGADGYTIREYADGALLVTDPAGVYHGFDNTDAAIEYIVQQPEAPWLRTLHALRSENWQDDDAPFVVVHETTIADVTHIIIVYRHVNSIAAAHRTHRRRDGQLEWVDRKTLVPDIALRHGADIAAVEENWNGFWSGVETRLECARRSAARKEEVGG